MGTYPKKIHFYFRNILIKRYTVSKKFITFDNASKTNKDLFFDATSVGIVYFENMEHNINSSQNGIRDFMIQKIITDYPKMNFIINKRLYNQFTFILKFLSMLRKSSYNKMVLIDVFSLNRGSIALAIMVSMLVKIFRKKEFNSIYYCIWDINDPLILTNILLILEPHDKIMLFSTSKKEINFLPNKFFVKPVPLISQTFRILANQNVVDFELKSDSFCLPVYKDDFRLNIIRKILNQFKNSNKSIIVQEGYSSTLDYFNFLNQNKFHIAINSISSAYRKSNLITETHTVIRNFEIILTGGLLISQNSLFLEEIMEPGMDYLVWVDLNDLKQIMNDILEDRINVKAIAKSGRDKLIAHLDNWQFSEL